MTINQKPDTNMSGSFLFSAAQCLLLLFILTFTVQVHGAIPEQIIQNLYSNVNLETGFRYECDFHSEKTGHELKVTSLNSVLLKEWGGDDANPKKIERFSTNGFSSYEQGGNSGGRHFVNEGRLREKQPVTGVALFASRFYQVQLLTSLADTKVIESEYEGEPTYVITGRTILFKIPVNLSLIMAKDDYLLLEEDLTMVPKPNQTSKLKAIRSASHEAWPYAAIFSETWSDNKITDRIKLSVFVSRTEKQPGDEIPELAYPDGTVVANDKTGKTYTSGPIKHISHEEMAKMEDMQYVFPKKHPIVLAIMIIVFLMPPVILLFFTLTKRGVNKGLKE